MFANKLDENMISKDFTLRIKISRILASATSIAGGYVFFYKFISNTVSIAWLSHLITTTFLIFIESGSITFITLAITNIYEKKRAETITFSIIAIIFLILSFSITQQGAKEWVNANTNKTSEISTKYTDIRTFNKKHYTKLINIERAKYDSLTSLKEHPYLSIRTQRIEQLKNINSLILYYTKRLQQEEDLILKEAQNKINDNAKKTKKTEVVYYIAAAIIIIFVFIFNFLLVFIKYNNISQKLQNVANNCTNENLQTSEIKLQNNETLLQRSEIILQEKKTKTKNQQSQSIEQQIISLKLQGYTQRKISAILNISESKISRVLKKSKNKKIK